MRKNGWARIAAKMMVTGVVITGAFGFGSGVNKTTENISAVYAAEEGGENLQAGKENQNQENQNQENQNQENQNQENQEKHDDGWNNERPEGVGYYKDNKLLTGWQTINGKKYHFDSNGVVESGVKTIDGSLYYLGEVNIDWTTKKDSNEKNSTGLITEKTWKGNIVKYYVSEDLKMATGWVTIEGRKCLFDKDGLMKSGWIMSGGEWYYMSNDAHEYGIQTGCWINNCWLGDDGKWSYKETGSWGYDSWGWWYKDTSGWYPTNCWEKIDGKWYYFDEWGYMVRTTWKNIGGTYYYFNFDGSLQEGSYDSDGNPIGQWIDGYWIGHDGGWTGSTAYWYWDGNGYQLWSSDDTWHAVSSTEIIDKEVITFDGQGYATSGGARLQNVPPMAGTGSDTKKNVVQYASRCLGFPYVYGGSTMAGTDCSGFTMLAYQHEGISLPHNAGMQYSTYAANEVWVSEVQPGDLLFYDTGDVENDYGTGIGHVALYVGNGETLEAGDSTNGRRWYAYKAVYVTK